MVFILYGLLYLLTTVLILLVLMQPHKSEGLTASSSEYSSIFGVSVSGGPIVKATAVVAFLIFLIVLGLHYLD